MQKFFICEENIKKEEEEQIKIKMAGLHGEEQMKFCRQFMCRKGQEIRNKADRRKYQLAWHPDRPECKTSEAKAKECAENFQNMNACIDEAKYYCDDQLFAEAKELLEKALANIDYHVAAYHVLSKLRAKYNYFKAEDIPFIRQIEAMSYKLNTDPVYVKITEDIFMDCKKLVKYAFLTPPEKADFDKQRNLIQLKVDYWTNKQKGYFEPADINLHRQVLYSEDSVLKKIQALGDDRKRILSMLHTIPTAEKKKYDKEVQLFAKKNTYTVATYWHVDKEDLKTFKKNYKLPTSAYQQEQKEKRQAKKLEKKRQRSASEEDTSLPQKGKQEKKSPPRKQEEAEEDEEEIPIKRKPRKRPNLDE